jgi:VWFA-related protein
VARDRRVRRFRQADPCGLLLVAALATAQPRAVDQTDARTDQQPYRERVDVSRVLIDARVLDGSGKPITGLTAADFAVRIDGHAATIETVDWASAALETPGATVATTSPAAAPSDGRWIVFLYQKHPGLSDIGGLMRLRKDLAAFAGTLSAEDHVAVLSFDTSLHFWLDFTSDLRRVREVLEHDILTRGPPRVVATGVPSLTARLSPEAARATYTIEKSLRLLGDALSPLPGAKTIVVLGYGMGTWVPRLGMVQAEPDYADTYFSLQKARVSVFCVDMTKADYHPRQEGLRMIAEDTGGFYLQSHVFTTAAFDRIAGALAGYYVLFVVPPDARKGTRQIDVTLVRRKGTVVAKRAYVAE